MSNKKTTLIVNDHTFLCLPTLDYTEELFSIISTQRIYLNTFLPWVDNIKTKEHVRQFLREAQLMNRGRQRLTCIIKYRGLFAGTLSLLKIDHKHKRTQMGYWLREDLQGKGIMTASCKRLVKYAFKALDLNRIEIQTVIDNNKSKQIPIRLNFNKEGILRDYQFNKARNTYEDVVVFSLLKKEWQREN